MAYPRFQRARDFKFVRRTSGDITVNSTTWANLDTATDLVLRAEIGDVIEVSLMAAWNSEAVLGNLTVVTLVGGTPVIDIGTGLAPDNSSRGVRAWTGYSGVLSGISGGIMYTLASGDISSDTVTLRLRYRTDTAANKKIFSNTLEATVFSAKNLGPIDPH